MLPGTCVYRTNGSMWCPAKGKDSQEGFADVLTLNKEANDNKTKMTTSSKPGTILTASPIPPGIRDFAVGMASSTIAIRAGTSYSIPVTSIKDLRYISIPADRVFRVSMVVSLDNFSAFNTFFRKLIANQFITPEIAKIGFGMDARFNALGFKYTISIALKSSNAVMIPHPVMFRKVASVITDLFTKCPEGFLAPLMKSEIIIELLSNNNGGNFTWIPEAKIRAFATEMSNIQFDDESTNTEIAEWMKMMTSKKCSEVDIYNMMVGTRVPTAVKETFENRPVTAQIVEAVTGYLPMWAKLRQ